MCLHVPRHREFGVYVPPSAMATPTFYMDDTPESTEVPTFYMIDASASPIEPTSPTNVASECTDRAARRVAKSVRFAKKNGSFTMVKRRFKKYKMKSWPSRPDRRGVEEDYDSDDDEDAIPFPEWAYADPPREEGDDVGHDIVWDQDGDESDDESDDGDKEKSEEEDESEEDEDEEETRPDGNTTNLNTTRIENANATESDVIVEVGFEEESGEEGEDTLNTTLMATGGLQVIVPCWTKTNLEDAWDIGVTEQSVSEDEDMEEVLIFPKVPVRAFEIYRDPVVVADGPGFTPAVDSPQAEQIASEDVDMEDVFVFPKVPARTFEIYCNPGTSDGITDSVSNAGDFGGPDDSFTENPHITASKTFPGSLETSTTASGENVYRKSREFTRASSTRMDGLWE